MTDFGLILQLFWTFFVIGAFTLGGGYAVMSLIQSEIVVKQGWISESTFTDIVAISQMTPGPVGLNCSTYVGYEIGGVAGSAIASLAIVLPSFIIMMVIVRFYMKFHEGNTFKTVMDVVRPAVAGMIGAAAISLIVKASQDGISLVTENFPDWKSWLIFVLAFATSLFLKQGPIRILAASAVIGIILYI